MAPRKKGLVPRLKDFWTALGERYHRVLQVVDDALSSENLKERAWAVDVILKKMSVAEKQSLQAEARVKPELTPEEIRQMDAETLMARIRDYLKTPRPVEPSGESDDVAD
jgi:hypothetical protein